MKRNLEILVLALLVFCLFSGCATTLYYSVERPAELDLHGATSISVLPFESDYDGDEYYFLFFFKMKVYNSNNPRQLLADSITNNLTTQLLNNNYMTVISSASVENALRYGQTVPCDVYLTGYISYWYDELESKTLTRTDGSKYNVYYRNPKAMVIYQVIDAQSNKIISYKSKEISASSGNYEKRSQVPQANTLLKHSADKLVDEILKELQPYTETKSVSLISDKTDDPTFERAEEYAKRGYYQDAEELFLELYEQGNYIAGFNAARIMQANGELEEAYSLMNEVCRGIDDKHYRKALSAMTDIQYELKMADKLQNQKEARLSH